MIGVSLSEPHINMLNVSGVCMYVCMYVCVHTSYRKYIRIRWITIVVLQKFENTLVFFIAMFLK